MKKLLGALVLVLALCLACTAFAAESKADVVVPENAVVNWGDLDYVTTIDGHLVDPNYTIIKKPSCSEYGFAEFECISEAGQHQHTLRIAKDEHKWSSDVDAYNWGKIIDEATCSKTGKAQDVCTVCGATREKYRIIEKQPHSYNEDNYVVFREPTCALHGLGQHVCIWCGEPKADEIDEDGNPVMWQDNEGNWHDVMVDLGMADHKFTDWTNITPATCDAYGAADRACIVCGMHQKLDDKNPNHDIYEFIDGEWVRLLDYVDGVKKLNPMWDEVFDWYAWRQNEDGNIEFNSEAYYQEFIATLAREGVQYKIVKNWLIDCYTREYTFQCPCCEGEVHEDQKVYLVAPATIAHQWKTKADKDLSRPATCTEDGYNIYLCEHDDDHGHDYIDAPNATLEDILEQGYEIWGDNTYVKDPQVKIEKVAALGHDWSDWEVVRTYTKDGKKYVLNVRSCQREGCHATEEEIKELTSDDGKNGLILEDDEWRYYEGNEWVKDTKIVGLEDGDFWIVDGVLASKCMGLTFCADGKFYYLNQGQIQRVSQLAEYENAWFAIKNGELDTSVNGLVDYDGGKFVFTEGRLVKEYNGLWFNADDEEFYFLSQGQVQNQFSGVTFFDGHHFLLKNGKLDADYEGTIEYDGAIFNVVAGQLYPIAE